MISLLSLALVLAFVIAPIPIAADDDDDDDEKKKSNSHYIEMSSVEMPDGMFAYKMDRHTIDGKDITEQRYGSSDPKPSIPGPTIFINEGDDVTLKFTNKISCDKFPDTVNGMAQTPAVNYVGVHVHGIHYEITSDGTPVHINKVSNQGGQCGGGQYIYQWDAGKGTAGTWPYHDHTMFKEQGGEDKGLFGTLIINEKRIPLVLLDGKFKSLKTNKIDKEFVLWMTSTENLGRNMFFGMEIDHNNGGKQTPLWVNPVLVATEGEITRWHIIGMGDEFHSFHLHGHRWNELGTETVIDTDAIGPIERRTFVIRAGEEVGAGDWNYHCHVFEHMIQGMSSVFRVLPAGQSSELPEIGAVITLSDEPGLWMKTLNAGLIDSLDPREGTGFPLDFIPGFEQTLGRSLAIIEPGQTVLFNMKDSETRHTITSLIFPENAKRGDTTFPFDRTLTVRGSTYITDNANVPVALEDPGLYVFVCKIHPYMFSAVIVDDPETNGFDLGERVTTLTRVGPDSNGGATTELGVNFPFTQGTLAETVPGFSLPVALLKTFFVITDPANWADYNTGTLNIKLPPVDVTDGTTVVNLSALDMSMPLTEDIPNTKGIGELWVNTQFERTLDKNDLGTENDKPGTITVVDVSDWSIERKISLPEINMNNPHNMWANKALDTIYTTQWFDKRMVAIDRESGEPLKDIMVGESPSHIMTTPNNDNIYIAMNGEEHVLEIDPLTLETQRQISTGTDSHPHGHWISANGQYIVTPNFFSGDASIINLNTNPVTITNVPTGAAPIATGMTNDPVGKFFYTADFLGNSFTKIDTVSGTAVKTIGVIEGSVGVGGVPTLTGIPIQTPVDPDNKFMVTAHVLNSKITVLDVDVDDVTDSDGDGDVHDDKIVAVLDCEPGCHGVQWGAKEGGGYFAYVSNKFSNALLVVDPDPNNDGSGADAAVVGKINLSKEASTEVDDRIIGYSGMGGQGVLAIPNVYPGWLTETESFCSANPDECSSEIKMFLNKLP